LIVGDIMDTQRQLKATHDAANRIYGSWPDKGPISDGRRLTVCAEATTWPVGAEVRVFHVLEILEPGRSLYVMGPKRVYGEILDGASVSPPLPDWEHPIAPTNYNGVVLSSPGIDVNFEVTRYRFAAPGRHELVWIADGLTSNRLIIEVAAAA